MKVPARNAIGVLLLMISCSTSQAQWRHTFADPLKAGGTTGCIGMGVDANGNVDALFTVATTSATNPFTFVIAQYSQSGARIWERTGPAGCLAGSLLVRPAGDIYISAQLESPFSAMLFHLASNGAYLFARTYSGVPFNAFPVTSSRGLASDSSGNVSIAMAGLRIVFLPSATDQPIAVVLKVNQNGFPLWANSYVGTAGAALTGIATDAVGDVIFEGTRLSSNPTELTGMFATGNGQLLWARQFQDPGNLGAAGLGIASDPLSGAIFTAGSAQISSSNAGVVLQKLDVAGQVLWRRVLSNGDFANAVYPHIAIDANDNVFIGGSQNGEPGVAQFDANGDFRWLRKYAMPAGFGPPSVFGSAVSNLAVTKSGNSIIDGAMFSTANGGTGYYFVLKYSPTGARLNADFVKAPVGFTFDQSSAGLASDLSGHIDWITDQLKEQDSSGEVGVLGQFP
ncbi:MAG: hypothetical protein KGJ62_10830 [Armatimonadetes bacterium]|nr:hypothetical protein [Armatimonadota bacterium]MDE2206745.1 hypothetical protein [Armatimonadota bacterium]